MFFTYLYRTFTKHTKYSKAREFLQTLLTIIAIVDNIVAMILTNAPYVSQFIRIFLLIVFIRSLSEALKRIGLVIVDSKEILLVVISFILLFSWVGYRLFRGTPQGEAYHSSLAESVWSMLVLMTTANFPDVMMLAYNENRGYAIFFIVYLLIVLFFIFNLLLAVYYSNYTSRVENKLNKFMSEREKFLRKKFEAHDSDRNGYLDKTEFKAMIADIFDLNKQAIKNTNLKKISSDFSLK